MYYRTLLAHSATSLLRLHKTFHQAQINFEFMEQLLLDDNTHNLLYALIFYCFPPFPCKFHFLEAVHSLVITEVIKLLFRDMAANFSICPSSCQ